MKYQMEIGTPNVINAIDHSLRVVKVSGFDVVCLHNRVIEQVNAQSTQVVDVEVDGKIVKQCLGKPGRLVLDEAQFNHLKACVEKVVAHEVPGEQTVAFEALVKTLVTAVKIDEGGQKDEGVSTPAAAPAALAAPVVPPVPNEPRSKGKGKGSAK